MVSGWWLVVGVKWFNQSLGDYEQAQIKTYHLPLNTYHSSLTT